MVIHRIPAFNDNYLWLFHQENSTAAFVVDPGDARPVLERLESVNLQLTGILITHHHPDHIGGVDALLQATGDIPVYGPDSPHITQVTQKLGEGDELSLAGCNFQVMEIPGHTLDHIAYFAETGANAPILFCGDTLFAGGCGRVFEGTHEQMYQSLQKLAGLPAETMIYCAHEYTLANLKFARAAEPQNGELQLRQDRVQKQRQQAVPTVPSSLADELATNPFLRCHTEALRQAAKSCSGREINSPEQVFAVIRQWKDQF